MTTSMFYFIVRACAIKRVAFYDRASTKKQQANYMRGASSDIALKIASEHQWEIVASEDPRNGGICFLDVGTGSDWNNRPAFTDAVRCVRSDTIAVLYFDRLARGRLALQNLENTVREAGKNLIVFTYLPK